MSKHIIYIVFVLLITSTSFSAERIFFEDCEDTSFSTWFLERSMGTSDSGYWAELTSEITRSSSSPYAGTYSMTYDPWTNGNPHVNIGVDTVYGNTDGFLLTDVSTSTYYFRWKHKWQTDINYSGSALNKNIYLGYNTWGGDFVFVIEKGSSTSFHILVFSNPGYVSRLNTYASHSSSLDDMQWHNMEVYIDLGTTGTTGYLLIRIDDSVLYENSSVYFRDAININDGVALGIIQWPANTSGTPTGTNQQWLDDLEIWNGLPNDETTPAVSEATANGSAAVITFDEDLDDTALANLINGDLVMTGTTTGASDLESCSETSPGVLTCTADATFVNGETITLSSSGLTGDELCDGSSNCISSISGESVTNNTPAESAYTGLICQ
jgi:hypothetical protein